MTKALTEYQVRRGLRFGQLTVQNPMYRHHDNPKRGRLTRCVCDCGKEVDVISSHLTSGNTTSCGHTKLFKGADHHLWRGSGELSGDRWRRIRNSASARGIKLEVTIEQAWELFEDQEGKCALSGTDIRFNSVTEKLSQATASLDRIDSSKPYVLGNIQWVHKDVNGMKWHLDEERFIEICRLVSERGA